MTKLSSRRCSNRSASITRSPPITGRPQSTTNRVLTRASGRNKGRMAISMAGLGNIDRIQGNYRRAVTGLEVALKLADESGVGEVISNVAIRLSGVHRSRGDFLQALKYAQLSVDTDAKFQLLHHISSAQSFLAKCHESRRLPTGTGRVRIRPSNPPKLTPPSRRTNVDTRYIMHTVHHYMGDYGRALELGQQALQIVRNIKAPGTYADVLTSVAETQMALGNTAQAFEMYAEALNIADKMGVTSVQLRLYNSMGQGYLSRNDYVRAMTYARTGLELAKKIGNKPEEWNSLITIGNVLRAKGDYQGAVESYKLSLEIAEGVNNRPLVTESLAELGSVYYLQGESSGRTTRASGPRKARRTLGMDGSLEGANTLGRWLRRAGSK